MSEREQWVGRLKVQRQATLAALAGRSDREMADPERGWRLQEVIGHLAAWEREALAAIHALAEGDRYQPPADPERFTEENVARRRALDGAQCRMDWGMARHELLFALRELSDEQWAAEMAYPQGGRGPVAGLVEWLAAHEAAFLPSGGAP